MRGNRADRAIDLLSIKTSFAIGKRLCVGRRLDEHEVFQVAEGFIALERV